MDLVSCNRCGRVHKRGEISKEHLIELARNRETPRI